MWSLTLLAAFCAFAALDGVQAENKIVCYYDSKSYYLRETQAKMLPADLEPALKFCTHLIYGYAGIAADTYKMVPLNENLDLDQGHGNYRHITDLRLKFPGLKILLSVGGGGEGGDSAVIEKYKLLLESIEHRTAFINSAILIAKNYKFDGIDLAWEFPKTKPKKIRGTFSSIAHTIKKWFATTPIDDKAKEHLEGFTALVREFRATIRNDPQFLLVHSVQPNTNSSIYHDVPAIIPNLDFVILNAFDYATPARNPKEADYTSPIYQLLDRNPENNVDYLTGFWLRHGAPGAKLVLGISTYGRAWKLTSDSQISGVPPITVEGPAPEGPYTKEPGLLSYPEICTKLNSPSNKGFNAYFRQVTDPSKRFDDIFLQQDPDITKRFGTYAFRAYDSNDQGFWVSYEDPDTAGNKALYVRNKGLGGVAIVDLSMDDFRGLCTGDKYPILRAAKYHL